MSSDEILIGFATIVVLGIGCQWIGRRLELPSILLLLIAGILAGPALGLVDPDALFGDALFPGVSLAVGLLLFDGGLGLRLEGLGKETRGPVLRLVTLGAAITFGLASVAVMVLFDVDGSLAMLIGAILVVSGPTVVGPLLRLARPRDPAETILRWEGIVIDPIGATLGIVMLEVVRHSGQNAGVEILLTAVVGLLVGLAAAAILVLALRRVAIPDDLEVPVTVMLAIAAFVGAELVQSEAGLFATTAMGVALANQRFASIHRIEVFGRSLGALILGSLFIVLGARIDLDAVADVAGKAAILVAVLVLVVRPIVAFVSTAGERLPASQRAFVAWMAPRGIVAAATSSLFAIELRGAGVAGSELLVPLTFCVIVGTGVIYGLSAKPAASLLGVARPKPTEVALVGSDPWLLALAEQLGSAGVGVTVIASGAYELDERTDLPYRVFTGLATDEEFEEALEDVGTVLVASPDAEHNMTAIARGLEVVGRSAISLLPALRTTQRIDADPRRMPHPDRIWDRRPFDGAMTQADLAAAIDSGARFVTVGSADAADTTPAQLRPGHRPVARIRADGTVTFDPSDRPPTGGERIVVLEGSSP